MRARDRPLPQQCPARFQSATSQGAQGSVAFLPFVRLTLQAVKLTERPQKLLNLGDHLRARRRVTGVNYFCRSTTTISAAVGFPLLLLFLKKVTESDLLHFFARLREEAGFFSSAAWSWAAAVR